MNSSSVHGRMRVASGENDQLTIKLKEPGLQARLFQFRRRRREIVLRIQLYHVLSNYTGRNSYGTQTNVQRFL